MCTYSYSGLSNPDAWSFEVVPSPLTVATLTDSAIGPRSDFRRTSPAGFDRSASADQWLVADASAGSDVVELVATSGEWNRNKPAGACLTLVDRAAADNNAGVFDVADIGATLPRYFWYKGPLLNLLPCFPLLWCLLDLSPSMWSQSTKVGGLGLSTTLGAVLERLLCERPDSICTHTTISRQHSTLKYS